MLGLYGGADTGIPLDTVEAMTARPGAGSEAAKRSEIVVYPEAKHAFFADYRPSYDPRRRRPTAGSAASAWLRAHGGRMTLAWIVVATLAGGVLSVVVAAALTLAVLSRLVQHLVSLSTGVLLATALLDILPEAFESKASPQALFATLLGGLLFFFLLEKAELYRHSHHHEGDDHHHHHGFDRQQAGRGGWSVILGDSIHNFCDGIIIAAAFLADTRLGVVTALAIIAHEIPQEVGDYIVLLNAGFSRARALFFNAVSGLAAVLGGVARLLRRRPVAGGFPVPARGRREQLHLRRRRRPDPAAAAPADAEARPRRSCSGSAPASASSCWRRRYRLHCATQPRGARAEPRRPAPADAQRTTSTGSFVCFSTSCVSLPRNSDARPLRPCEPMTIRSQSFFSAWATIASHGCMPSTVCAWQATPAASQASITARTWRVADALLRVEEFLRRRRLHLGDRAVGERLLDAERVDFGAERLGQADAGGDGAAGELGAVGGDQDALDTWRGSAGDAARSSHRRAPPSIGVLAASTLGLAPGDRPRRIGRPLAPGARVEQRCRRARHAPSPAGCGRR